MSRGTRLAAAIMQLLQQHISDGVCGKSSQLDGWPDAVALLAQQLAAQLHQMPAAQAKLHPQQDGTRASAARTAPT
jgi:hypothetical protein